MTARKPNNLFNQSARRTVKEMTKFLKIQRDVIEGFWEGRIGLAEEQRIALVEKLRELAAWATEWGDRLEKPPSLASRMQVIRAVEKYINEDPDGRIDDEGGVDSDVIVACKLLTIAERNKRQQKESEWQVVAEFALSHGIDLVEEPRP